MDGRRQEGPWSGERALRFHTPEVPTSAEPLNNEFDDSLQAFHRVHKQARTSQLPYVLNPV